MKKFQQANETTSVKSNSATATTAPNVTANARASSQRAQVRKKERATNCSSGDAVILFHALSGLFHFGNGLSQ